MEDYKKRIIIEYSDLYERTKKLELTLQKYDMGMLEFDLSCPVSVLRAQHHIMLSYLHILELRSDIENIEI